MAENGLEPPFRASRPIQRGAERVGSDSPAGRSAQSHRWGERPSSRRPAESTPWDFGSAHGGNEVRRSQGQQLSSFWCRNLADLLISCSAKQLDMEKTSVKQWWHDLASFRFDGVLYFHLAIFCSFGDHQVHVGVENCCERWMTRRWCPIYHQGWTEEDMVQAVKIPCLPNPAAVIRDLWMSWSIESWIQGTTMYHPFCGLTVFLLRTSPWSFTATCSGEECSTATKQQE